MSVPDPNHSRLEAVNRSGFLLQLAVAHFVKAMRRRTAWDAWEVLLSEHAWKSSDGAGFVDLVLARARLRLVVECKRAKDDDWVFLQRQDDAHATSSARCFWTRTHGGKGAGGWHDFYITGTPWAEFCVIRDRQRPLLEAVASDIVAATDAFAVEELLIARRRRAEIYHFYLPTIITTARLFVARVDGGAVSMFDGTLTDAAFAPASHVLLHKALSTRPARADRVYDVCGAHEENQRSVLVISAAHLGDVLPRIEVGGDAPWTGEDDQASEFES